MRAESAERLLSRKRIVALENLPAHSPCIFRLLLLCCHVRAERRVSTLPLRACFLHSLLRWSCESEMNVPHVTGSRVLQVQGVAVQVVTADGLDEPSRGESLTPIPCNHGAIPHVKGKIMTLGPMAVILSLLHPAFAGPRSILAR